MVSLTNLLQAREIADADSPVGCCKQQIAYKCSRKPVHVTIRKTLLRACARRIMCGVEFVVLY